jgi:hypothetical protein
MSYKHKDKDGNLVELSELKLSHLYNIIAWIQKRARAGVVITSGSTIPGAEYLDTDTYYGDEARDFLHYDNYIRELTKRGYRL